MTVNDVEDVDADIQQIMVIPSSRIWLGNKTTTWNGGPKRDYKNLARPIYTMNSRPKDFKYANIINTIATKGPPVDCHLRTDKNTSNTTLTLWIISIHYYMEEQGLDTVFYVYSNKTDT